MSFSKNDPEINKIQLAKVESITEVGEGTRVCIDLIDVLEPDEGVFVGNTGHGYCLLLSESIQTDTYPPRPFRVNAGAVHQYILMDDDKTSYLSDLRPGIKVPVYKKEGQCRLVSIGRIKIEKRPMIRVSMSLDDVNITITVQKADSVSIASESKSKGISIESLNIGDKVCCCFDQPGRHIGERVDEYINELYMK